MNYVFLSQNSISCFYYIHNKINNFHIRLFILLTFFTVPVWSAFSEKNEDLFKLKSGDSYANGIYAFSFDGKIGGGVKFFWDSDKDLDSTQAYIFRNDNKLERDLGNHKGEYSGNSAVKAFSSDGKIVGGYTLSKSNINHATIWTTNNDWNTVENTIDLSENAEFASYLEALSANGKIAGGYALSKSNINHATIWTKNNDWNTVENTIDLSENAEFASYLEALSANGKIAGGYAQFDSQKHHAAIWTTNDDWAKKYQGPKDLLTLKKKTPHMGGFSELKALSTDGKIAGGWADNDVGDNRAAIWTTDDNWQTFKKPIDLGTLEIDNSGSSRVTSFSSDGQIAGGWASPNTGDKKAVIWFTNDSWKHVGLLDLGTLRKDNSGSSEVSGLSSDGTTIIGTSDTDYGLKHNFIKRVPRAVYANLD